MWVVEIKHKTRTCYIVFTSWQSVIDAVIKFTKENKKFDVYEVGKRVGGSD